MPFHGDDKEDQEVDNKDGPEHRNVECIKKCTKHRNEESPCYAVPDKQSEVSNQTVLLKLEHKQQLNKQNYQNLNSGKRLMNGLNSAFALVGSSGPSSGRKRAESEQKFEFLTNPLIYL